MKAILILGWMALLLSIVHAQMDSATPPPFPGGPAVKPKAPDLSEWVVSETAGDLPDDASASAPPADSATKSAPLITQQTITKTRNIIRVLQVDSQMQTWTVWCSGSQEVMIWPDGKVCEQISSIGQFYYNYIPSNFPLVSWVSQKNYKGIKEYQGKKCIVYEDSISLASGSPKIKVKAYVDLETRLPVLTTRLGSLYAYTWNAPPTSVLTLPTPVSAVINRGILSKKKMAMGAVAPF